MVFGNVLQTSADAIYGARHIALKACVPVEVPALTVNRLCGSGIQAAVSGAHHILAGEADVVLTGGLTRAMPLEPGHSITAGFFDGQTTVSVSVSR